jgi:hypothetical protein
LRSLGLQKRATMLPDTGFFVALEGCVWQALADGDGQADANLLDPQFLGIYASGWASREDHVAQLANGPTVANFSIHEPRLLTLASNLVMLAYRASFTRPGGVNAGLVHSVYISSIWRQRGATWLNVFSQDTLASEAAFHRLP